MGKGGWSEGYSSIDSAGDSANERASSAAKSTRLITCFLFLFYLLPGTFPAGQGAPRLQYRGTRTSISWLLSIPYPLAWSHPLCLSSSLRPKRDLSFFHLKVFFIRADPIRLCRPNTTKALCPLLPHCVAIDSVLSGKKLIQALPGFAR